MNVVFATMAWTLCGHCEVVANRVCEFDSLLCMWNFP